MSIDEFNRTKFTGNMKVTHNGRARELFSVNFEESLIGLLEDCAGHDLGDIEWVRCENVTVIS